MAMTMSGEVPLAAPRERVWAMLNDPAVLKSCIPGCEQFDIFQGTTNSDQVVLLERWVDQAALDAHAKLNRTRPPLDPTLRQDTGAREDYEYNRTR